MRDPWISRAATTTAGRCLSPAAAAASTTTATTRAAAAATRCASTAATATAAAATVAQNPWTLETPRFGVSVLPFTPLIPGVSLFAEGLLLFVCQGLSPRQLFRRRWLVSGGPGDRCLGGNGESDGGCGNLGCGNLR